MQCCQAYTVERTLLTAVVTARTAQLYLCHEYQKLCGIDCQFQTKVLHTVVALETVHHLLPRGVGEDFQQNATTPPLRDHTKSFNTLYLFSYFKFILWRYYFRCRGLSSFSLGDKKNNRFSNMFTIHRTNGNTK